MVNQEITFKKFKKQSEEMGSLRFYDMKDIFPFQGLHDTKHVDFVRAEIPSEKFDLTIEKGHVFKGPDNYLWIRKEVEIPKALPKLIPYGYFDFGRGGCNEGFEALLYVNGKPFQGIDENHREVCFNEFQGQKVELTFMLWSGLDSRNEFEFFEHKVAEARIGYLHDEADKLYFHTMGIAESLDYLDKNLPEYQLLILAMEQSLKEINWDREFYYDTVETALEAMEKVLSTTEKRSDVTVHCVGHTHIDVAWLWRLKHTREKEIRSFTSALRQMEMFKEYKFIQSQPQLYKYIKSDRPDIYAEIKKRVADGSWEPEGGMWVEADCNISSGEALSRQLLYGINFFKEEFDKKSEFLWLPDVFGYSWALPQILKLCEIKTFMTTKISWNQYNTIPNDLFKWRGIDGSEILTYFIDTANDDGDVDVRYSTYNGKLNPRAAITSWNRFKNKELSNDVLIAFGYGDGGGGPTLQMQKLRRVMDKLPGLPNVVQTSAGEFFNIIHDNVKNAQSPIHTWDGELYLEYHRGTYTSQAKTKKWNRVLENQLVRTEWLANLAGGEYPKAIIDEAWEVLMVNQFHDIIPGSSIADVYKDADIDYRRAYASLINLEKNIFGKIIAQEDNKYTVLGFNSFNRETIVSVPESRVGHFTQNGDKLISQKIDGGYNVQLNVDGLELALIDFVPEALKDDKELFSLKDNILETPHYKIRFDKAGFIESLYDKDFSREVVQENGRINALNVYEDKPIKYENWDIDFYYTQKMEQFEIVGKPLIIENGPLYGTIKTEYVYGKSKIIQTMKVYSNNRRIDIHNQVSWYEDYKLLKATSDLNVRSNKAAFDIQYGYVERPTHSNTSWDVARFEVVAHKWADISESNYGVSIINDCKYGYSVKDSTISLTLLKSTKDPDPDADRGEHEFVYSILPHEHQVMNSETIKQSHILNYSETVIKGKAVIPKAIVSVGDKAVIIDAIKTAEDGNGLIVRLHESRGGSVSTKITTTLDVESVQECNIIENPVDKVQREGSVLLNLKPFEIKSFRIILKPA